MLSIAHHCLSKAQLKLFSHFFSASLSQSQLSFSIVSTLFQLSLSSVLAKSQLILHLSSVSTQYQSQSQLSLSSVLVSHSLNQILKINHRNAQRNHWYVRVFWYPFGTRMEYCIQKSREKSKVLAIFLYFHKQIWPYWRSLAALGVKISKFSDFVQNWYEVAYWQ